MSSNTFVPNAPADYDALTDDAKAAVKKYVLLLADALADAGLLVSPERDREQQAKALREAANEVAYAVDWDDAPESVESWLSDRIGREGGES